MNTIPKTQSPQLVSTYRSLLKRDLAKAGGTEEIELLGLIARQEEAERQKVGRVVDPDGDLAIRIAAQTTILTQRGKLRPREEILREAEGLLRPRLM